MGQVIVAQKKTKMRLFCEKVALKVAFILITEAIVKHKKCGLCSHVRTIGRNFWPSSENVLQVEVKGCMRKRFVINLLEIIDNVQRNWFYQIPLVN